MTSLSPGRRVDRTAVFVSLAAITAIAWTLMVQLAAGMSMPAAPMDMAAAMSSTPRPFLLVAGMWAAMMVGMMVPSATPMVVTFTDWTRRGATPDSRVPATSSFVAGYLLIWVGFSLGAALVQVALERAELLTAMGAVSRPALSGGLLVAAGVFQVTPWKEACLRRCRTPLGFLIAEWRDGPAGALVMGVRHGAYCLGCCWALMAVLFAVGTMHLVWMGVIAGFVLAEKVLPRALRIQLVAAAVLIAWGVTVVAAGA